MDKSWKETRHPDQKVYFDKLTNLLVLAMGGLPWTDDLGRKGEEMIDEEYRGYNLTGVRRSGMWQVSIYPLSVGQNVTTKPRGQPEAQAVTREDAFIEARQRVDALLAGDAA
jgi:hypothetical protein